MIINSIVAGGGGSSSVTVGTATAGTNSFKSSITFSVSRAPQACFIRQTSGMSYMLGRNLVACCVLYDAHAGYASVEYRSGGFDILSTNGSVSNAALSSVVSYVPAFDETTSQLTVTLNSNLYFYGTYELTYVY